MIAPAGARAKALLVSGAGALMLIAGGLLAAYALQAGGQPTPYAYEASDDPVPEAVAALAGGIEGATASTLELKLPGEARALATAHVLDHPQAGEILVGWESAIGEPLLRSDFSAEEEGRLITALKEYLPPGALVLAMPATSRRLGAVLNAQFPLASVDDSQTLYLPAPWSNAHDAVAETERRWAGTSPEAEGIPFTDFVDALVSEDRYGVARLQVMAGGRESYLVLHARDAFDIGVAAPERIAVGLRDFPGGAHVHDMTRQVKAWMGEEGHASYAVLPRGDSVIRAWFLADAKDKSALIGQLLPFNTARIGMTPGAAVVFQHGGYWVYRIAPVQAG